MNKDTEFKIFAHALSTEIGNGANPEDFVKELFSNIYVDAQDNPIIEDQNDKNYRNYYYGDSDITRFVKKITGALIKDNFSNYILNKNMTDDSIQHLCDVLSPTILDISKNNYHIKIAERFEQIIHNAAAPKRKKKKVKPESVEENTQLTLEDTITEKYGAGLMAEAGNICPYDGCSKPLMLRMNGVSVPDYAVVIIDKSQSSENTENMIALCHSCALKFSNSAGKEDISRLQEIKKKLLDDSDTQMIVSDQYIEESIRNVILKIPDIDPVIETAELNYQPVPINNKIEKNNHILLRKVKYYVENYYNAVESTFKELSGIIEFRKFCRQIGTNYDALYDKGYDQIKIFDRLVDWLQKSTNGNRDACEIVIAFFVQKCEVFDDISG